MQYFTYFLTTCLCLSEEILYRACTIWKIIECLETAVSTQIAHFRKQSSVSMYVCIFYLVKHNLYVHVAIISYNDQST